MDIYTLTGLFHKQDIWEGKSTPMGGHFRKRFGISLKKTRFYRDFTRQFKRITFWDFTRQFITCFVLSVMALRRMLRNSHGGSTCSFHDIAWLMTGSIYAVVVDGATPKRWLSKGP